MGGSLAAIDEPRTAEQPAPRFDACNDVEMSRTFLQGREKPLAGVPVKIEPADDEEKISHDRQGETSVHGNRHTAGQHHRLAVGRQQPPAEDLVPGHSICRAHRIEDRGKGHDR